jgi:hypothetical protein
MARLLKPGGVFLLITYGQPKTRLHYLCKDKYAWDVEQRTVGTAHLPRSPAAPSCSSLCLITRTALVACELCTAKQAPPDSDEKADVHYIYICRKKK